MRSGTSYFDRTLFKKNWTGYWPYWASYLTIWLFIMPIMLFMEGRGGTGTALNFYQDVTGHIDIHIWFAAIYGVFSAMAVMSPLYTSRSANFYGALPVRREGLFLTQYLSGLSFTVFPQILVAILTTLVGLTRGAFSAQIILTWLGVGAGTMFVMYTLAFFCGLFTGHILAMPIFYIIVNFLAEGVYTLVMGLCQQCYYGFYGFADWVEEAAVWCGPIMRLSAANWYYNKATGLLESSTRNPLPNWPTLLIYCGVAVLLFIASFFLYKRRKLETAGDVVAVRAVRPVFKYGLAVCVGLGLGIITSEIFGDGSLPYLVVAWTVVGYFAGQMLLDKSFRVFRKWRGALAVGVVMAAAMACVVLDVTGFETWVPDPEDVTSVQIHDLYSHGTLGDDGDYVGFTVTDRDLIRDITDIHREAVAAYKEDRERSDELNYISINMTYTTRTGEHQRHYWFYFDPAQVNTPGTAAHALQDIYNHRQLYWTAYGFENLETMVRGGRANLTEAVYTFSCDDPNSGAPELMLPHFNADGVYTQVTFSRHDAEELFEAMKSDFFSGRIGARTVDGRDADEPDRELRFYYMADRNTRSGAIETPTAVYGPMYPETEPGKYTSSISIYVSPSAERTLEALVRLLPDAMEFMGWK